MKPEDLRSKLKDLDLPESGEVEERSWRAVRAVYTDQLEDRAEEETGRRGLHSRRGESERTPSRVWFGGFLAALIVGVVVISPARALVGDLVGEVFDGPRVESTKISVAPPGGGRLLVEDGEGTWVVQADGSRRLLGDFTDPVWSPQGRFVAAVDGRQLAAFEPGGELRWALTRPTPIELPSWNSPDGFRIAYIERNQLRIVAGDGTGDSPLANGVAAVRPAWRPGPAYQLAFVRRGGRVEVVDTRSGGIRFGLRMPTPIVGLEWSSDAAHLLVWTREGVVVLDEDGRRVWSFTTGGRRSLASVSLRPGRNLQLALLENGEQSRVVLAGPGQAPRTLLVAGNLEGMTWSPSGKQLLVGWKNADQWLFLQGQELKRVDALAEISGQFSPGSGESARFPEVAGWCCQR